MSKTELASDVGFGFSLILALALILGFWLFQDHQRQDFLDTCLKTQTFEHCKELAK